LANNFSRTLRALRTDGPTGWLVQALVATLLLALWGGWFFGSRVTVLAVSASARAEVDRQVNPVEAPVAGRIVRVQMELGAEVEKGQLLVELEVEEQRFRLDEQLARQTGLAGQLESLRLELNGAEKALNQWQAARQADLDEARARYDEARQAAELAAVEAAGQEALQEKGLVSEMELRRARSEAERTQSTANALRASLLRLEGSQQVEETTRRAELDNLRRETAQLEGEHAAVGAAVDALRQELALRNIRAPADGRLGEVVPLQAGAFVDEGDRLAAVVPTGRIRAVAEFASADAVGRIHPGQTARLRLTGFPSTRYGSIPATVARVGSEAHDGQIRVELDVTPGEGSSLPLEHGLPGTVEVEVERLSPAALVLRTAGKLLDRPAATGEPPWQANAL
jgi:membrane fusion protein (multidrug efflux system)